MRIHWSRTSVAIGVLIGALACAGGMAKSDETGTATAKVDSTRDTTNQNPPGYRGMERDTSMAPVQEPTPTDTFLQNQGTGQPQDTAGYSGMERMDTTGGMQHDTTMGGMQHDTTSGMKTEDTTGYDRAQQQDTTSR